MWAFRAQVVSQVSHLLMPVIQSRRSRGVGPLLSLWRCSRADLSASTDGSTRRCSSSSASCHRVIIVKEAKGTLAG
jgi:hypothetical protein